MSRELGTEAPAPAASPSVWVPNRTIQIGTCQDEQAMLVALEAAGRRVGSWARDILRRVKYSPKARRINLVWPSVSELGLGNWAMVEETFNRGLKRGLELCEWEDGPQLAAQYLDQPYGEVLYMAMTPILNPYGLLCRFSVGHGDDGQWLDGGYKYPKDGFRGHDRLVFRCK